MEEKIKMLRTFFKVSTAAFEFQDNVVSALNGVVMPNKMKSLHMLALSEMEKDSPDLVFMDNLLAQMEKLADENKKDKLPKYPKGMPE